jgi:hypothetical protein
MQRARHRRAVLIGAHVERAELARGGNYLFAPFPRVIIAAIDELRDRRRLQRYIGETCREPVPW